MAAGPVARCLAAVLLCAGAALACVLGGCDRRGAARAGEAKAPGIPARESLAWEPYVSRHWAFTLRKPTGWQVGEIYQDRPRTWGFTVADPTGRARLRSVQGLTPEGRGDLDGLRAAVADMARDLPGLKLAPTARLRALPVEDGRGRPAGRKTLVLLEGSYRDPRGGARDFRSILTCGGGLLLDQRIEAEAGRLEAWAPVLLQTLASLRVAKGVFRFDEGGAGLAEPAPGAEALEPRRLASGWARLSVPAGWKVVDLGQGGCIASDPGERLFVMVSGAEFVSPRYAVRRVPGVFVSDLRTPSEAFAFSALQTGAATGFRFQFVQSRPDMVQTLKATAGPLRPVAVEDFGYTCLVKGRPYRGFSTGGCSGDAMGASWRLWHFTLMAPEDAFPAALPLLAAVLGSYELNQERAGRRMADNLRAYYAGLRDLGSTLARNSEQMRRENLQGHMERGRVQDYISYQTTRMIMGEFDYLAGASGYVRGSSQGLDSPDGTRITSEPYGGSVTRGMQEVDSRELFEAVRR